MKRILSILLALVMVIGMLPMTLLTASAAGTYEKATSIAAGDTVILVCESKEMELSGISNTSTKYGIGVAYSGTPAGVYALTVCAGSTADTFAFKTSANNYLCWSSGNSLTTNTTVNANTSWKVTIDSGNATILNAKDTTRKLQWNAGSPRFACYTSGQTVIQLYKLVENETPDVNEGTTVPACTHAKTEIQGALAATCTTAGKTGNIVCLDCEEIVKASEDIAATGHDYVDGTCSVCGATTVLTQYELVTNVASLTAGDKIIIVGANADKYYAMLPYTSGNNVKTAEVSAPVENVITLTAESEAARITLGGDSTGWTLFDGTYYFNAPGGTKSNYLKGVTTLPTDNTATWTISIDSTGKATIVNVGNADTDARNTLKFNYNTAGSYLFSCYKANYTSNAALVSIYREVKEGAEECQHANTTEVAEVAATCGKAGTTAGVKCVDCGDIISGCEEIPATGNHNFVDYICDVCGAVDLPAADSTLTLPVASAIAAAQAHNTYTADKYYVTGVVESVTGEQYGNMYIQDENGNKFYIYGVYSADGKTRYDAMETKPVVGDTVTLYGVLGSYNGTAQMRNAWLTAHTPAGGDSACEHANTTVVGQVDATCTTVGSTGTVVCSDCGATVTEATEIPVQDHNYVDGTCSVCGKTDGTEPELPPDEFEQVSVTITFDDTAKRTEGTTSKQVWEENGIVVTNTGSVNTQYYNPVRFYKNSVVKIAYPQMTKIVINSASGDYLTQLQASITDGTVTVEGTTVTIELDEAIDEYTITLSAGQARANSITVYAVAGVCAHEVAEDAWTIVTPVTCETAGSKTGTCSKCGETVEKEIPALGHAYSYNAETGMMVCANCGNSVMNTIAEAKAYTDGNQVYYLKGMVTYVSGQTVYMQDATGGICVYFTDDENAANIAVGDELLVMDTLTTYNGLVETTYTKSTEVQVLSNGNELPVQTVTIADLLADKTNEYLGERVQIVDATIGMINSADVTPLTVGEDSINIYKLTGQAANVTENDIVTVTAIVSTYNGYQLLVNPGTAATDVVVTTEGVPTELPLSTIADAKVGTEGTFFKVKGVVTFVDGANVYMQDATGGIVARLATGVTAPAIGTEIEATGAYTTYYGLIQLEGATFTEISTGNSVDAKEVTIADLTNATNNDYLSEKVILKDVVVTATANYSTSYENINYTISDGTNTIVIYRAPAKDNILKVGDKISVTVIVSTNDGYRLRLVSESDITMAKAVASIGDTLYYSFETAYAAATSGQIIKLLDNVGEVNAPVELTKNLFVDLNGNDMYAYADESAGYVVRGMDSANAGYDADACGTLSVSGASVALDYNSYLAVNLDGNLWSFHAYSVELTHVSLEPGKDALGYKAELKGDEYVQSAVLAYGFEMGVSGGVSQTYIKNGQIDDGVFSLRLQGIMAANGGEMEINAVAYVTFNGAGQIKSDAHSTTMRQTIEYINNNWADFDTDKQAAVAAYVADNYEAMKSWNIANIYDPETEEVPAA